MSSERNGLKSKRKVRLAGKQKGVLRELGLEKVLFLEVGGYLHRGGLLQGKPSGHRENSLFVLTGGTVPRPSPERALRCSRVCVIVIKTIAMEPCRGYIILRHLRP